MNECVYVNNEIKREGGGGFFERFWLLIVRVGGKKIINRDNVEKI